MKRLLLSLLLVPVAFAQVQLISIDPPEQRPLFPAKYNATVTYLNSQLLLKQALSTSLTQISGLTCANGQSMVMASGAWSCGSAGAVASVFGRTGVVVAASGDYTSDQTTEGSTNLFFTNARARAAVSASGVLSYNSTTGVFTGNAGLVQLGGLACANGQSPLLAGGVWTCGSAGGASFTSYNDYTQIATPGSNPASGFLRVYGKTGAGICWLDSAGSETCAGAAGAGGVASTDVLYKTAVATTISTGLFVGSSTTNAFRATVNGNARDAMTFPAANRPTKMTCVGDSITAATGFTSICALLAADRTDYNIINHAISGQASYTVLGRLYTDVLAQHPDYVYYAQTPINDGFGPQQWGQNWRQALQAIRRAGQFPILGTTVPSSGSQNATTAPSGSGYTDHFWQYNMSLGFANEMEMTGYPVIDLLTPNLQSASSGNQGQFIAASTSDGRHMSQAGLNASYDANPMTLLDGFLSNSNPQWLSSIWQLTTVPSNSKPIELFFDTTTANSHPIAQRLVKSYTLSTWFSAGTASTIIASAWDSSPGTANGVPRIGVNGSGFLYAQADSATTFTSTVDGTTATPHLLALTYNAADGSTGMACFFIDGVLINTCSAPANATVLKRVTWGGLYTSEFTTSSHAVGGKYAYPSLYRSPLTVEMLLDLYRGKMIRRTAEFIGLLSEARGVIPNAGYGNITALVGYPWTSVGSLPLPLATAAAGGTNYQTVQYAGSAVTQRPIINYIAGTNVTLSVADNAGATRTDVTINATAGSASNYQTLQAGGTAQTQQPILNLIGGSGISITPANDNPGTRTNVTIASAGLAYPTAGTAIHYPFPAGLGVTTTNTVLTAGATRYFQMIFPAQIAVRKFVMNGGSATSSAYAFAIYDSSGNKISGTDGNVVSSAAGAMIITLSSAVTLNAATIYYFGYSAEAAGSLRLIPDNGLATTLNSSLAFATADLPYFSGTTACSGTGATYTMPTSVGTHASISPPAPPWVAFVL